MDFDYLVFSPLEERENKYHYGKIDKLTNEIKKVQRIDPRVSANYKFKMMNKRFKACYANWSVITVNWNGEVQYCCHKPDEVVGHIMDGDIIEKKRNFRTDMIKFDVPCRLSGANEFMEIADKHEGIQPADAMKHVEFV